MASAILAIRKTRTAAISSQQESDEEILLEDLVLKVPPQETWEAEFCLDMLVAG
jgi:hypothetical protein